MHRESSPSGIIVEVQQDFRWWSAAAGAVVNKQTNLHPKRWTHYTDKHPSHEVSEQIGQNVHSIYGKSGNTKNDTLSFFVWFLALSGSSTLSHNHKSRLWRFVVGKLVTNCSYVMNKIERPSAATLLGTAWYIYSDSWGRLQCAENHTKVIYTSY